jgi:hypothetical protein
MKHLNHSKPLPLDSLAEQTKSLHRMSMMAWVIGIAATIRSVRFFVYLA